MNAAVKRLDVICIGRVAVDLYAQQIGSRLEERCQFREISGRLLRQRGLWHRDSGAEIGHAGARWR